MKLAHLALLGMLLAPLAARGETDRERAAREIDEQMKQLVKLPPAALRVVWQGADSDQIGLDEARFELDDARLSYGELSDLEARAKSGQPLYDGPIDEGKHTVAVTLIVHRTHVSLFEGLRKTTYKVSTAANLPGQRGLSVAVRIKLHYDEKIEDVKKRLRLDLVIEPKMTAAVDDAPPPEPPHTVVAHAEETSTPPAPPLVAAPEPVEKPKVRHAAAIAHEVQRIEPAVVELDAGPLDAGIVSAQSVDAGPPPFDAGPPAPPDAGPPPPPAAPPSSSPPYGLAILVALLAFAAVAGFGYWKTRQRF